MKNKNFYNIKKYKRKDRGITLVALVVTIVILLILAGITIVTLSENGLFEKTKIASEEYKKQEIKEQLELIIFQIQQEKLGNATLNDIIEFFDKDEEEYIVSLTKISSIIGEKIDASQATEIYVIYKGYQFKIDDKLKITILEERSNIEENKKEVLALKEINDFTFGMDKNISELFTDTTLKTIYEGKTIKNIYELQPGQYRIIYSKSKNILEVIKCLDDKIINVSDFSNNNCTITLKNEAKISIQEDDMYALEFDGVDDYCEISTLPETINWQDGFTIEFEAIWEEFNYWSRIIDFANGAALDNIAVANYFNESNLDISFNINGVWNNFYSNEINIIKNEKNKYKIEVVKNNNMYNINYYQNDNLVETQTTDKIPENIERTKNYIAKSNDPTQGYFKGKLYNLKITQADGTVALWYDFDKYIKETETAVQTIVNIADVNIYDLSGSNYQITLKKETKISRQEDDMYALEFDGVDDYCEISTLPETINWQDGFTIEFEAIWEEFNYWSRIIDFANGAALDNIAIANYLNQSNLDISFNINGVWNNFYSNEINIIKNEKNKYKIEVVKNNNMYNINYYQNDNLVETQTTDKIPENIERTKNYIAKSNDPTQGYFKGKLYNLKITQADGTIVLWYDINKNVKEYDK